MAAPRRPAAESDLFPFMVPLNGVSSSSLGRAVLRPPAGSGARRSEVHWFRRTEMVLELPFEVATSMSPSLSKSAATIMDG